MNINLKKLTLEQFNYIMDDLNKDEKKFVNFTYNSDFHQKHSCNSTGIFLDDKLVGIFYIVEIWKIPAIRLAILREYRGKNIATYATDKIIDEYGKIFFDIPYFYSEVDPFNQNAINLMKKSSWERNYNFDEIISNEGGSEFLLYTKPNPHFKKEIKEKGVLKK